MNEVTSIQQHEHSSGMSEWLLLKEQATTLVKSGFLPKAIDTPEKAAALMLAGREFGLPAMQSIRHLFVLDGKVSSSAEMMLAMIYRSGKAEIMEIIPSNAGCTIRTKRIGHPLHEISFTAQDAGTAGLSNKDNWKKYPRAMYRSRAISEMARTVYPDVVCGLYTPEEIELPVIVGSNDEVTLDYTAIPIPPLLEAPPVTKEEHTTNYKFLKVMAEHKERLGTSTYYTILARFHAEHADEIVNRATQKKVHEAMLGGLGFGETANDTGK